MQASESLAIILMTLCNIPKGNVDTSIRVNGVSNRVKIFRHGRIPVTMRAIARLFDLKQALYLYEILMPRPRRYSFSSGILIVPKWKTDAASKIVAPAFAAS